MKYNQPFDQPSSPNAPYVDGNPSAGIQGSIVPAASIEFPQREIMNAITAAGLVGTNADLTQMLQMMKIMDVFNKFKIASNGGNASQWSAAIPTLPIMPPPQGCTIWFHPVYDSVKGGTVFSVNGSAFAPVTNADATPIDIGDVIGNGWLLLFFDGTQWRILAGTASRITGVIPLLQTNAHWYVNGTTGDDTNYDGTSATFVSGHKGPFRTINRATQTEIVKYNMNGYSQFVHVAAGNYVENVITAQPNGAGSCFLVGNPSNPAAVSITASGGALNSAIYQTGGFWDYDGLRLAAPGCLDGMSLAIGNAQVHSLRFGACGRYHLCSAASGAQLMVNGYAATITVEAGANCVAHLCAAQGALLTFPFPLGNTYWPNVNILGAMNVSDAWASGQFLGILNMRYNSVGGGGFVNGRRYDAFLNGIVNVCSGTEANLPGNAAGVVATGGQFSP